MIRFLAVMFLTVHGSAQPNTPARDFLLTLERIACLSTCPEYKITIHGDGSVQYEGRYYVRVEGIRKNTIALRSVQKLITKLRDENLFEWEEKKEVCVDYL